MPERARRTLETDRIGTPIQVRKFEIKRGTILLDPEKRLIMTVFQYDMGNVKDGAKPGDLEANRVIENRCGGFERGERVLVSGREVMIPLAIMASTIADEIVPERRTESKPEDATSKINEEEKQSRPLGFELPTDRFQSK